MLLMTLNLFDAIFEEDVSDAEFHLTAAIRRNHKKEDTPGLIERLIRNEVR